MKEKYDEIVEVSKGVDELEHIEKFNPFHDSRGRFSSARGMASYSANPKTKAGAMAIDRSTAAGYGGVMNVHRESKGENIRQNDNWIKSGKKPTPSQMARAQAQAPKNVAQARQNAHTNRVRGTMGATETANAMYPSRAKTKPTQNQQQQKPQQSQQQNQTAQQTAQQATAQSLKANVADVQLSNSHRLGIQPRDSVGQTTLTRKLSPENEQARVAGKDISSSFDPTVIGVKGGRAIDKVAEAQGWRKNPTVTDDLETFQKAAAKSGQLLFRSVDYSGGLTPDDVCKLHMEDPTASLGGGGGKMYGGGMYCVGAQVNNATGRTLGRQINKSQSHSYAYGSRQMMATVHPDAKIASPSKANSLQRTFLSMSARERAKFDNDIGAYIASKGYDGAQWHTRSDPYITMYNKSAMIFYSGVASQ